MELKKLEWDSLFFDMEIYSLQVDINYSIKDTLIQKIEEVSNKNTKFLIQTLIPSDEHRTIEHIQEVGFEYVETKINLTKDVMIENNVDENMYLKKIKFEDTFSFRDILFDMYGENSRFTSITSSQIVNKFYYEWIINSIVGRHDDECIGYYSDGQLNGFLTYKIRDNRMTIGLLGVLPDFQGRGISSYLIEYAAQLAAENKCKKITISTQESNTKAISVYLKKGFMIESKEDWYYYKEGLDD